MTQLEMIELENAISDIEETAKELRKIHRRQCSLHMEESLSQQDLHLTRLQLFWKTRMTDQIKRDVTRLRLKQMTKHLNSFEDTRVKDGFVEATVFAKKTGTWRFMECICSQKFEDQISFDSHLSVCHQIHSDLGSPIPQPIQRDIEDFILKGSWKLVIENSGEDHRECTNDLVKIRVFEFIQNAQRRLKRVCQGRCDLVKELECIKGFKNKFDKELESREKIPVYKANAYTSILQKRKDELVDNAVSYDERKVLEIISELLTDKDVQIACQFDSEKWNQENRSRKVEHINRADDAVIKACLRLRQQNLFSSRLKHLVDKEVAAVETLSRDKRKDHRKGTKGTEQPLLHEDDKEAVPNHQNSEIGVSVLANALQQCKVASDNSLAHQIQRLEKQSNAFGTGLENNSGENNCFLNVIIQSLWHLTEFRKQFMKGSKSDHAHVGAPCVVCALFDIFNDLHIASSNDNVDAISPTPLRIALSNLNQRQNLFQMGQMNDADEVLDFILRYIHRAYTSSLGGSGNNCEGSSSACIMHSFFGMRILEAVYAENLGPRSIHPRHSFVLISINMNELRTKKSMHGNSSFNVSVNLALAEIANENSQVTDWIPPLVLRTVLSWPPTSNDEFDIANNFIDLATQLDIGGHFQGLKQGNTYTLISMVCYYAQHYVCFIYGREQQSYVLYNDRFIEVVGGWDDVKKKCIESGLKPVLVIYEIDVMDKSDVVREALSAEVAPGGKEKIDESWNIVGQGQTYLKHIEDDEYEKRFQADIEKAVCQSLVKPGKA
ncbi:hypothetical protein Dsin_007620 [Dipteronia sinensis]|uniref:USP domain-containing protein n=1 Tax=Dipteronia sinensis TaxID=43782 RepID=A0AAE0B0K1_9ROSI|nr:hypothetical protein Dsin_007620 [Dipteronia sinensis]